MADYFHHLNKISMQNANPALDVPRIGTLRLTVPKTVYNTTSNFLFIFFREWPKVKVENHVLIKIFDNKSCKEDRGDSNHREKI